MKFTMTFPPLGHAGAQVRSFPLAPPVLEYMAGLVSHHRPDWDVRLINANVEQFNIDSIAEGLVAFTILTHQAKWVYHQADELRRRGLRVILGGPHVSALPDEALQHADAVITGESESVIAEVLADFERDALKPRYAGELRSLDALPTPRRDLLKDYIFHGYSTARGCPWNCKFCATPYLHGKVVRHRPIGEVIADIRSFRHKMWFSTDPDIWGPDVGRYIDLFKAMSSDLSIYWAGEGSLSAVQHARGEEMLRWAKRSGLMQVWVGWESFSEQALKEYGATAKMHRGREEALRKIRDAGIDIVLFMMMGAPGETMAEYERALEMTDRLRITPHPVMLVPYPGTALREELGDRLLYGDDWDFYDGMHSTLTHEGAGRDNAARDRALVDMWVRMFTWPRIISRITNLSWRGLPSAHIASIMVQSALRKAFMEFSDVLDRSDRMQGR